MVEQLNVTTERVDDIPILLTQSHKLGIAELLDEYFKPHGNWVAHILSEGDHRMNQVQPWVAQRMQTLQSSTGQEMQDRFWSDDRLALVLDALSDDRQWQQCETSLTRQIIRVYQLKPKRVRVDSTTVNGYWTVNEQGLFQCGHSKDHRPDLPQLKVMLSALDPLGLPVATQVVSGERADDPLSIPAIDQVSQSLDEHGLLYVGDCKMAALPTRAYLQAKQDSYLCPLAEKQLPESVLQAYLQPVWAQEQPLSAVYRDGPEGQPELIAEGYERLVTVTAQVNGQSMTWTERHLVVRSHKLAQAAREALQQRLTKAQTALEQLKEHKQGKKRYRDGIAWQQAAQALITEHRVEGLLVVAIEEQVEERRVRAYGKRPTEVRKERAVSLQVDATAVAQASRRLGCRVYASNHPKEDLPLEQAVLAYHEEYLVERGFGRLKGNPLSLSPMYLHSDRRATGLIRLLSLGLRVLTLLEWTCRQRLADSKESLPGLYAGNPKRTTSRPTAEALLTAFKDIHLSVVTVGHQLHYHVTPLSDLQTHILSLLGFSSDLYDQFGPQFLKPT